MVDFKQLEERAKQFAPMFSGIRAVVKYKDGHIEADFESQTMQEFIPQFTVMVKDALVGMLDRFGIKGEIVKMK